MNSSDLPSLSSIQHLKSKKESPQPSGLGMLESFYFEEGSKPAQDQLRRLLGREHSPAEVAMCVTGDAAFGVSISAEDEISYDNFSPPAAWNVPYSIQRVQFGNKEKQDFIFHNGEEIVIPAQGEVTFHFYWSSGAREPRRILLDPPATRAAILRVNPQVPHHFWGSGEGCWGWLILRHASDSPVALVADTAAKGLPRRRSRERSFSRSGNAALHPPLRRRVTVEELQRPGTYALIAWGISELIRQARQKTGLTATDLAVLIGVDPSSLSRLEEAKTNVSIEMLARVCAGLRIGIANCIETGSWLYDTGRIDSKRIVQGGSVLPPSLSPHKLHPYIVHMAQGHQTVIPAGNGTEPDVLSSWIVMKGRLLIELPKSSGDKSIVAESGNVIHFRGAAQLHTNALKDSTIVKIAHSVICGCSAGVQARVQAS